MLRKLVTMISNEAKLHAEGEAARAQARSASQTATQLLEEKDDKVSVVLDQHTKMVHRVPLR